MPMPSALRLELSLIARFSNEDCYNSDWSDIFNKQDSRVGIRYTITAHSSVSKVEWNKKKISVRTRVKANYCISIHTLLSADNLEYGDKTSAGSSFCQDLSYWCAYFVRRAIASRRRQSPPPDNPLEPGHAHLQSEPREWTPPHQRNPSLAMQPLLVCQGQPENDFDLNDYDVNPSEYL